MFFTLFIHLPSYRPIMKLFAAVATLILATFAAAQHPTFSDCSLADSDLLVSSFTLTPYPLCIGYNHTITVTGFRTMPIIDYAKLKINGRYLGRIVYVDNTHDLCSLLAAHGSPCPVPTTQYTLSMSVLVKSTFPKNVSGGGGRT
jgi:hypothetical protein